jgi:hypothetical protein
MGVRHVRIAEKIALAASWGVTVAAGCAAIAAAWLSRGNPRTAANFSVLFGVLMTCVYVIGYEAYKHQGDGAWSSTPGVRRYWPAIKRAALEEVIVVILALLALDDGFCLHVVLLSLAAHWSAVCLIVVRRPNSPTAADLLFVKYGFFFILIIFATLGPTYWARVQRW